MFIIFEDCCDTPVSVLLRHSVFGSNIIFSEGVSQIKNKVNALINLDDTFIIYYDFVPDNFNTVKYYSKLSYELKNEYKNKNIFIIPIICIEYVIISMFIRMLKIQNLKVFEYNASQILVDSSNFDYKLVERLTDKKLTLEKKYKNLLGKFSSVCMVNKNIGDNNITGLFYKKDCDCSRYHCRYDISYNLTDKADMLYLSLPLIISTPENDIIAQRLKKCIVKNVGWDSVYDFYRKLCKQMDIHWNEIYNALKTGV